jgi:hypothetical protein
MNTFIFKIIKNEDGREIFLKRVSIIPKKGVYIEEELDKAIKSLGLIKDDVEIILENIEVECKPPKKTLSQKKPKRIRHPAKKE